MAGAPDRRVNPQEIVEGSDKLIEAGHLNGMGAVYEKRREFPDAERLYEEALAIYEEVFGTEHFTTALVIRNLARVLRIQGKTAEASLLEDQASDILTRRAQGGEAAAKNPFGGSSGFFELMGDAFTRAEQAAELTVLPADSEATTEAMMASSPDEG